MFKEEIKHDMREEFLDFERDVYQQLATNMLAMQEQSEKISKVATWIDDMETWSVAANAALQQVVQDQKKL